MTASATAKWHRGLWAFCRIYDRFKVMKLLLLTMKKLLLEFKMPLHYYEMHSFYVAHCGLPT